MPATARILQLEERVSSLEKRVRVVVPRLEKEERQRVQLMVLAHLKKHATIDAWRFAFDNELPFDLVYRYLERLRKKGSVERADE